MSETARTRQPALWLMVGLLLLAAALTWHQLGAHEVLGRDENATITKLDQPSLQAVVDVTYIKVTGQPGNMQPLYFLLQYLFWPWVGRSATMLRFLPSLFALLAVGLTYKLGEALWSRRVGLVGALLTALLPLHVQYAQIARPYTLLLALSLASAYLLVAAQRTGRRWHWLGFVVAAVLAFYTHYNAVMVLLALALYTGVVWVVNFLTFRRGQQDARRLLGPVVAFLLVAGLCLPGLIRLLQVTQMEGGGGAPVTLSLSFAGQFLYRVGLTTAWHRALLLGLLALGIAGSLLHHRWQTVVLALAWLLVPFLMLALIPSPRPFEERYVIFVPPVALLLAGQGVTWLADLLSSVAPTSRSRARWLTTLVLSAGLALTFVGPLRSLYASNRSTNRIEETVAVVERLAGPGDLILVSPRFFVGPLDVEGAEVLYLEDHPSISEFEALLARHGRVWILYTSYLPPAVLQESLDRYVLERVDQFVRVPIKAIVAVAYHNRRVTGTEAVLLDRAEVLEALAAVSVHKQEAWLRYSALAEVYDSLSEYYAAQGAQAQADEYRRRADEARATAPPP